jgi:ABC-type uncharacterized transport system auxiliary subunit
MTRVVRNVFIIAASAAALAGCAASPPANTAYAPSVYAPYDDPAEASSACGALGNCEATKPITIQPRDEHEDW